MSEEDEGRDHDPTQKKLEDARARGDIARSADLTAAAAMGGFLLVVLVFGPRAMIGFGQGAQSFLGQAGRIARRGDALAGSWGVAGWVMQLILPLAGFFVAPGLAALLCLLAQRGVIFSGEKLAPRLSRINPFANAARRFGRSGLFDYTKSLVKLLVIGGLAGWFLTARLPQALLSMQLAAPQVGALTLRLLSEFLIFATMIAALFGMADFVWQKFDYLHRNRMTRQEMIDEFRQSEGDPHVKGQRRQLAQTIALNRMLADVARADVVVVNPTHFAVALKWSRASGRAPICLAKGTDAVAARIRERAAEAGVPIHSDPPTARALFAGVEIGDEIRAEHYAAVAAAIRFAERMRRRARERGFG